MSWSLVAAGLLAVLTGGDLRHLAEVRIRAWWLLVAALAIKLGLIALHAPPSPVEQPVVFGLVALGAAANWRLPGLPLIAAGLLLNVLAVGANGGFMPFSMQAYVAAGRPLDAAGQPKASPISRPETSGTRLEWLDDRIPFPPTHQVMSVGDIAIMAGGIWLVVGITKAPRPHRISGLLNRGV